MRALRSLLGRVEAGRENATVGQYGKADVFINKGAFRWRPDFRETTIEQWNKVMNINPTSLFLGMKYVIPYMQANKGGSIA